MRIHYLQHVSYEGVGYIRSWAEQNGHSLAGTHFFNSEALPPSDAIDALIIMGGPMGIDDEQQYSWLIEEKEFIKSCIGRKVKVIGICLGAQLIADVLGAEVVPMAEKEIGWYHIDWTQPICNYPVLDFLPDRQMVFHWHGDMFSIPEGATRLAKSEYCENQAFIKNDHILGLQFHLEMTKEGLSELIAQSAIGEGKFVQDADQILRENYFNETHQILEKLLDRFLDV